MALYQDVYANIDLADVDEFEGEYKPEFEPRIKSDVDMVIDTISATPELSQKFGKIANELPDDFLSAITANAGDLQQFASHVDSGLADELLGLAAKEVALGNGSLLENYL